MAAPIFTQQEANGLIRSQKVAVHEAWTTKQQDRQNSIHSVVLEGETDDESSIPLRISFYQNQAIGSTNIILEAKMTGRPWEGICRYDIHDSPHKNLCGWMHPPEYIEPGIPHRHIYSERAERELGSWHARAEILDSTECSSPERLLGTFMRDMKFHFTDKQSHQSLFSWINE